MMKPWFSRKTVHCSQRLYTDEAAMCNAKCPLTCLALPSPLSLACQLVYPKDRKTSRSSADCRKAAFPRQPGQSRKAHQAPAQALPASSSENTTRHPREQLIIPDTYTRGWSASAFAGSECHTLTPARDHQEKSWWKPTRQLAE